MGKQVYYHFLSSKYAIEDLEDGRMKVSTLDTLNDPFEFMPYRRYGVKDRQPYNKVFRVVSKKWGVLCFSQTWREQLLWAHYADKHGGIALGFKLPENELIKVAYTTSEIREKVNLTENQMENEKLFLNLAGKKFREWEYEKEFRLLIRLKENCEFVKGKGYFISFSDKIKLEEIVLGCRFDHRKNQEKIAKLGKRLNTKIIPTREGWEDYRIHPCGTKTRLYED